MRQTIQRTIICPPAAPCTLGFVLALRVVFTICLLAAPTVLAQPPDEQGEAAAGRALFAATGCSICHGPDGTGTTAGPRIATEDLTLEQFIAAIRQSLRTMPAFDSNVLPDPDASAMYAFLASADRPQRAPAGRSDMGAESFAAYGCYSCHSNEAQGGMHGPRLGPDPITFARFSWYVRHPSATMPPYSPSVLTEQEIADIYAFVESRPAPPPITSIQLLAP